MQALQAVILAGRVGTLRSAQLPQRMAVEAAVVAMALPLVLPEGAVEVSVQRGRQQAPREPTVVVVVVPVAVRLQVSVL